jgi:hypothetical protein
MIVICKKETKKLVKGVRYEAEGLWNNGTNRGWLEGTVQIKNIGRFTINNFTDTNGNSLPKINIIPTVEPLRSLRFEDIKEGDIVVCLVDSYKTIIKGGMYKIESKIIKKINNYGRNYIKLEGLSRYIIFSPWCFRKLTPQENREMSINSLLEGKSPDIIKSSNIRKIDMVKNKDAELINLLCKSILDRNRHHLSIVDWAVKIGNNLSVKKEDYKDLINLKLSEIFKKIENE